jgi:hypothetical protein
VLLVTIENCRLAVSDADLAKFLGPRLAKKGIRHLGLKFEPGVIYAQAEYPLNRFGFGDIRIKLTLGLNAFDPAEQAIELRISDFDLSEAGDQGLMGKMLGLTMNVAKRITGAELVKKGLEFLRGRLAFLDVDAPGLKVRVKIATLAAIVKPYVNNLKPTEIQVEKGRLIVVQTESPV